jgi:hypothetical protein
MTILAHSRGRIAFRATKERSESIERRLVNASQAALSTHGHQRLLANMARRSLNWPIDTGRLETYRVAWRTHNVDPHSPGAQKLIFDERFEASALPARWYTDTAVPKYANGAWDCRSGDGVIIPLPHDAWKRLRVEIELTGITGSGSAFCGTDSRTGLSLSLAGDGARHAAFDGSFTITQTQIALPVVEGSVTIVFEWDAQQMRASVGEVVIIACDNMRHSAQAGGLQLGLRGCIVKRVRALGEAMPDPASLPKPIDRQYPLDVTVDFNDDLIPVDWTHNTFKALFSELKSWGASTVSWIDLGRAEDDYFSHAPYGIGVNAQRTMENVGDIFSCAVSHAHAQDLQFIGILKPFDMAIMGLTYPPSSEMAIKHGRVRRIGGTTLWSTRMAEENQHLIMARKPSAHGPAINKTWTRIDLVKEDDAAAALSINDISVIVSDDNESYCPYDGPITRSELVIDYPVYRCTPSGAKSTNELRRSRVYRLENLHLTQPFVAIEVRGNRRSFTNRLCDLVHVFGEAGEETRVTYGLSPRKADHVAKFMDGPGSNTTDSKTATASGPAGGFEYNRYPGSPTNSYTSGGDAINTPLALDRGAVSYLALARGKDHGPGAVMSPSFPETRALWMTWVAAMLDAGADGINLRPGHHHADFAWCEYGFEQPVRDEMLRRTGVDIWETDEFDRALWRNVRGEGWTQFIREMSAVVRARGKKVYVYIESYFDAAPGTGGGMNITFDWRQWLNEGLVDGVTAFSVWPGSSLMRDLVNKAHAKGVPVTYTAYCNNFFEDRSTMNHIGPSPVGCEVPVDRLIQWGKESGYDGFGFYEEASALWATEQQTVVFRPNAQPLRDVMQKHFR